MGAFWEIFFLLVTIVSRTTLLIHYCTKILQNGHYVSLISTQEQHLGKQAQICAEGCEGENFTQILCKYCTNIVKLEKNISLRYCANFVWLLFKYCTNIEQILYNYGSNIV